jgi:tetratricopeptide (TPR) repeat protein
MITRTLELADWEPRYPLRIARRATDLGHHERAAALYARAIEINPRYTLAYYEGARALIQLGRIDEAAAYWEQVLALAPQTVQAYDEAAGFYASTGNPERAGEIAAEAAAIRALAD